MKTVIDFLEASPTFHVATVDENNHPRVRPFSFVMEWEGKPAFVTNTEKNVYKQLLKNPSIEISSFNQDTGEWMRISGKVTFFKDVEANRKVLETMPMLRNAYTDEHNPIMIDQISHKHISHRVVGFIKPRN